jgi:hypothetical protein
MLDRFSTVGSTTIGLSAGGNRNAVLSAAAVTIAVGCLMFAGCGRSDLQTIQVRGNVTYNGKPVVMGMVKFQPVNAEKGRPAMGTTDDQGNYTAGTTATAKGIMPGEYKVSILAYLAPPPGKKADIGPLAVPKRYTEVDSSGLTASIGERDSSKVIDFELKD